MNNPAFLIFIGIWIAVLIYALKGAYQTFGFGLTMLAMAVYDIFIEGDSLARSKYIPIPIAYLFILGGIGLFVLGGWQIKKARKSK